MKKINYLWLLGVFMILSTTSCSEDIMSSAENDDLSTLAKAGTSFDLPNTFDKDGNLCINVNSPDDQVGKPMQLWMGVGNEKAGTLVGTVTFLHDPDRVRIDLTDTDGDGTPDMFPYVIDEAHIHFAGSESGIPQTEKGNPIPGQFEYNVPVNGKSTFEIPVEFHNVGAIHLSVQKYGGIEGFNFYLPNDEVTLTVIAGGEGAGGNAYAKLKITGGGFISDYDMGFGPGVYEGWCIDADHSSNAQDYAAYLYSSYEELPAWLIGEGKIEKPQNLDLINYLVNFYNTGDEIQPTDAICGNPVGTPEILTFGDIQSAIWQLIDDELGGDLGPWSQNRVNTILCDVYANGENFIPGCDQKIVFLVIPTGDEFTFQIITGQPVIGQIPVPCETMGGTAWGDGYYGATFPGSKQWGTWFEYDPTCEPAE